MADKYTPQDLQDNLDYLNETKRQIKQAIIDKEQSVSESDTFRSYADKIRAIETGIKTDDATATAADIIAPKTAYVKGEKVTGAIEPIYGGTSAVLSENTYNVGGITLDDINYEYSIGIRCTSNSVIIYKLYGSNSSEIKDSTTLTYAGYAGTGRFAAQSTLIDNIAYLRCFATDNTSSSGTVGVISFLVKLDDYSIVTTSIKRSGFNTGNTTPAIEAVPFTDNRCIIQVNHASSSIGYSRTGMFTCANTLSNTITSKTLKNWSGNTNNYGVDTVQHSIQFSPDGRYMCSHYYGYGKYNSYVRHTLILYSTDHFTTYTTKKDDGGTRSTAIYKIINNDYYTYNGVMYNLNTLASTGKSFPVTPGSAAVILALGNYIFYASSADSTSMTVYSIDGTTISNYKTISNIKTNSIYFHYGDTIMYTTSNQACWYILDKIIVSLTRIGDTFYNTTDADAIANNVLAGKKFYNSTGQLSGTMPNNGAKIITPSTSNQTIAAGYHSGSGYVKGDSNLLPENIKSGTTIFDTVGTYTSDITETDEYSECLELTENILNGGASNLPVNGLLLRLESKHNAGLDNEHLNNTSTWNNLVSDTTLSINNISWENECAYFNGTNTYFDSGLAQSEFTGNSTYAFRLNPTEWSNYRGLFGTHDMQSKGICGFEYEDGTLLFHHLYSSSTKINIDASLIPINTWTTLVMVVEDNISKVYINGELVAQNVVNSFVAYNNMIIGRGYAQSNRYYKGYISHIYFYNRALSKPEIDNLISYSNI